MNLKIQFFKGYFFLSCRYFFIFVCFVKVQSLIFGLIKHDSDLFCLGRLAIAIILNGKLPKVNLTIGFKIGEFPWSVCIYIQTPFQVIIQSFVYLSCHIDFRNNNPAK